MAMQAATLEILEKADLPPRQARAIAQAIELEVAAGHNTLATRADLRADLMGLQHSLETQIAGLKYEIVGNQHELDARVVGFKQELDARVVGFKQELEAKIVGSANGLELKMAEHKSELVRWVFLCILGQSAMLLGVGYFLFSHMAT